MKNKDQDSDLHENDVDVRKNLYLEDYKTTNINILLNRVRLDKKKAIRKKLFFTTILFVLVSGFIAYLLI